MFKESNLCFPQECYVIHAWKVVESCTVRGAVIHDGIAKYGFPYAVYIPWGLHATY